MSMLFGQEAPAPQPVPASPNSDAEAQRRRQEAEREAVVERASAGRRSTIVGGMAIAQGDQQGRGLLASQRRAASGI